MPELPEVETVRAGLDRWVVGRTISAVEIGHPRSIRRHVAGAKDFAQLVVGRTIAATRRRGKFLWLPLDSGDAIVGHLGMSGQLLVQPSTAPAEKHLHIRFDFADKGPQLRFVDQRTFGGLAVSIGGAELPREIEHIAKDPLEESFVDKEFVAALRKKRTAVKRALLDQKLISGVGNIYADEALWRARIRGDRPSDELSRQAAQRLLDHVKDVLREAIKEGDEFRRPVRQRERRVGILRPGAERLWPGGGALPALRHADQTLRVHEQVILLLPALPAVARAPAVAARPLPSAGCRSGR